MLASNVSAAAYQYNQTYDSRRNNLQVVCTAAVKIVVTAGKKERERAIIERWMLKCVTSS